MELPAEGSGLLGRRLSEVLQEATEADALRARVMALEAELIESYDAQSELMTQLSEQRRRCEQAEQALLCRNALIPRAATAVSALGHAMRYLGLADLGRLGQASTSTLRSAQDDRLWQVVCAQTMPPLSLANCNNFKAALLTRRAAAHIRQLQVALEDSKAKVLWTLSPSRLDEARRDCSEVYSGCVQIGAVEGFHLCFYPGGTKKHRRCAFYVRVPRETSFDAIIYQNSASVGRLEVRPAREYAWYGWDDAGPGVPWGNRVLIQVHVDVCKGPHHPFKIVSY